MFYWIYDLQTWTMVFLVCAFFVGVTWLGTIFIRPFLRAFLRRQPGLNDIVGYLLGAHGVYFGILLGLLALASYQNFSDVEKLTVDEATKLAALYRDIAAYPPPLGEELTGQLRKYTRFVIDEAWPLQKKGIVPTKGTHHGQRVPGDVDQVRAQDQGPGDPPRRGLPPVQRLRRGSPAAAARGRPPASRRSSGGSSSSVPASTSC